MLFNAHKRRRVRECPAGDGQQAPREEMSEHTGTWLADSRRKEKHKGPGEAVSGVWSSGDSSYKGVVLVLWSCDPFEGGMTLSQGSPKTIKKYRYLLYDSYQ